MNNQVKLIDAEKLLEWLDVEIEFSGGNNPVLKADGWAFNHVRKAIIEGKFAPDTPPAPTIKPGDKVRHKDWPLYGIGTVISIAKSGLRARVEFKDAVGMWGTPLDAYYLLDKLEVVE